MAAMQSAQMDDKHNGDHVESANAGAWENTIIETEQTEKEDAAPRTDRHGLALIPQPSQFRDDPLVSPAS